MRARVWHFYGRSMGNLSAEPSSYVGAEWCEDACWDMSWLHVRSCNTAWCKRTHVSVSKPLAASPSMCSCYAAIYNLQRYSTCKAWWPCSSTELISSFAAWRGAGQHQGSSARKKVLRQWAGVTKGLPAPSPGRTSNFDQLPGRNME